MTDPRDLFWVARFRTHPLGGVRYARDFYNWWLGCQPWRDRPDVGEEEIRSGIQTWLGHERFHLSTEDLQRADLVFPETRDLYEKWLDVEMIPTSLTTVPADSPA